MASAPRQSRRFAPHVLPPALRFAFTFHAGGYSARIDFLEGVTTQQSFVALGRALDEKMGSCSITAMNKLALFDESADFPNSKSSSFLKLWVPPWTAQKP
jgi:hypothetical protein